MQPKRTANDRGAYALRDLFRPLRADDAADPAPAPAGDRRSAWQSPRRRAAQLVASCDLAVAAEENCRFGQ